MVAWDALTAEQQRRIGAAAIVVGIAQPRYADRGPRWSWGAAWASASVLIMTAVGEAGLEEETPDLNGIGVRMCRACGCTDLVSCECGCTWVGQTRCSRHRRKRAAALRADAPAEA